MILGSQSFLVCNKKSKFIHLFSDFVFIPTQYKYEIIGLTLTSLCPFCKLIRIKKFIDRRFVCSVLVYSTINHSQSSNLRTLDPVSQLIELFSSVGITTSNIDCNYAISIVKYPKSVSFGDFVDIDQLHTKTHVWFIATKPPYSLIIGQYRNISKVNIFNFFKHRTNHPFKCGEYIVSFYKTHFAIDLSKFGLTVCSEVFISKTLYNLVILVQSTHHEQLFERLRTLRKGIILTFIHPTRNDKVTSTFRSRFNKNRSFYIDKIGIIQIISNRFVEFASKNDFVLYGVSS